VRRASGRSGGVVVDGLLAEEEQFRAFLLEHGGERLRGGQRLDFFIDLDVHGAIGTEGQRGAQGFLALRAADGHGDDFGQLALFLQAHRLFHRDLVKRVDAVLHTVDHPASSLLR
jgi:hypothetical protein